MTDTDELRDKLILAVAECTNCQPNPVYDEDLDADTWDGAFCAKHLDPWPCESGRTVDNLWPVVREALADAWYDGHEWGAHNEHEFRPGRKITNPWRVGPGDDS